MYKEVKFFLEILKFVKNYQRFLSKFARFWMLKPPQNKFERATLSIDYPLGIN